MILFQSLLTAAFVVLICLRCIGIRGFLKRDTFVFDDETSYYNDFDFAGCLGRRSLPGTYLVNKYSRGCISNFTNRNLRTVPVLFTSSLGSNLLDIFYELESRGFRVTHEDLKKEGSDARLGWYELFAPSSLARSVENLNSELLKKTKENESILYIKIVHQISDPLITIRESEKFCSEKNIWNHVSTVTPFIKFYLYPHVKIFSPGSAGCTRLLMYHWWSWNRILHQFSDYTFLAENIEFSSLCMDTFHDFPALIDKCKKIKAHSVHHVAENSKSNADLSVEDLYQVDCELANRIFYAAIEYGYTSYDTVLRKCGEAESNS